MRVDDYLTKRWKDAQMRDAKQQDARTGSHCNFDLIRDLEAGTADELLLSHEDLNVVAQSPLRLIRKAGIESRVSCENVEPGFREGFA